MTRTIVRSTDTATALVTRMADALSTPDGGFTVCQGRDVTDGYAVAVYPEREQQLTGRVNPCDVREYAYANADLAWRHDVAVGGWRDPQTGIAYLDLSRVVSTREEATRLARKHDQVAYFDLRTGQSVRV